MKAKDISGQAPGGTRTPLADALPLDTPFVVQFFPIYACNFKCNYCIFSVPVKERGFISDTIQMPLVLFQKCIDELALFPQKVKVLRFVGIGEPLLHKELAIMVEYAIRKDVAHTVELLTNGALLTPDVTDSLIQAGLTRLVVSLQGTSAEKYRQISGVNIDLDKFIANLSYFDKHKKNTQVYLKVVDTALEGEGDTDRFYELFGDICDTIAIEHMVPIHAGVKYDPAPEDGQAITQFGLPVQDVPVCPQPFFTMQVNPDGNVVPCFSFDYPKIIGNCHRETLADIWNGDTFRQFRRSMLDGTSHASSTCSECKIIKYRLFPEDDLRHHVVSLKSKYE